MLMRLSLSRSMPIEQEQQHNDDDLLVAAARVDRLAFAPLYARYVGAIYRYCHARLQNREAAEDATGEIFVKALAALPDYRDQTFAAWLFRIAHNVVVDQYRRRRPSAPFDEAAALPDASLTPAEVAIAQAEQDALWQAIATLPDEQRATIELQLIGWDDRRIGGALGRSPAAVRMLRLRALGRLRVCLDRER